MTANDSSEVGRPRRGLVGRVIGERYRITRVASAGANTVIADADDAALGRQVTVKLIRPEWAESEQFRQRFARTMRAMSTMSHPNVAAVYDWGEEEIGQRTTTYTVVEHLTGGSLRDLFDRGRLLDPSQALMVGLEACRALDFVHHKGVPHTELTPSKLVFGDDRRLRIVDFGLARLLGDRDWTEPATVATHVARYASPEQALGQKVDGKTDVYSLALIVVEAVTGTVPFAARSTVATLSARVGRLMPVSADLGPLASVLERAGRPDPAERSTAAEFGRGLVGAAERLPRPAPIPIVASRVFEEDPEKLRRPNDPTGGVHRPEDTPVARAAAAAVTAPPAVMAAVEAPPNESPATSDEEADESTDEESDEDSEPPPPSDGNPVGDEEDRAVAAPMLVVPPANGDGPGAVDAPPAPLPPPTEPASAGGDADHRSRRRWLGWVVALVVVGALGVLGYLAYRLFRTPTHEVPALVGLREADATRLTADFDWEIDVETARSDEEPEPGAIIRTAPEAGEDLAEGEPFLIVVSEGPELRTLPELAGRSLSDAETALAELRLVALPASEQFDEDVPAGDVVSWSVPADPALAAGGQVLPDTEVALVVSAGPAPRTIPELVGEPLADATAQLESQQLIVTVAESVFSDTVPTGGVVSVEPPAGTTVERGSTVNLVPSKGVDLVTMPDLTGQTLPQMQATLAAAGLNLGSLLGSTQGVFVSASVAGESAEPGDQYKRGSAVDIVLL